MRRMTVGTALLLVAAVPAVVVLATSSSATSSSATSSSATSSPALSTELASRLAVSTAAYSATTPAVLPALGPLPSSWEGGHAVAVAPRWWPRGHAYPSAAWPSGWPKPVAFSPTARGSLSGVVIALDPGHNIGNGSHISAINKKYWVGLTKTCNTTGTATNAGYPEATFTFDVVARLRRLLVAHGATVVVTRDRNSRTTYGPCVGARGAFPAQEHAALMVSVHGDGAPSSGRGFHVIVPGYYKGYTDDIAVRSRVLGNDLIASMSGSFMRSTYLSSTLSVRKDQGTLNMSDVPTAVVETLNMRNSADARIASSAAGRQRIAAAIYAGIARYLGH